MIPLPNKDWLLGFGISSILYLFDLHVLTPKRINKQLNGFCDDLASHMRKRGVKALVIKEEAKKDEV